MAFGILTTIIASAVQVTKIVHFTFIWAFDSNGVFHLIQIVAFLILTAGLHISLRESTAPLLGKAVPKK